MSGSKAGTPLRQISMVLGARSYPTVILGSAPLSAAVLRAGQFLTRVFATRQRCDFSNHKCQGASDAQSEVG